jgi:hypothetical protein
MRLLEYSSAIVSGATRVDREAGIIRDVAILSPHSSNNRSYTPQAIQNAAPLYEGKSVFIDHQINIPETGRSYRDKIGTLVGVRYQEGKLRGDLRVNLGHANAAQLLYDAEHNPSAVGLSHDADGVAVERDGQRVIESITKVRSVDLVAEPSSVTSLYESVTTMPDQAAATATPDPVAALYASLTLENLQTNRPDLFDMVKKQVQAEITAPMESLKTDLDALRAKLDEYATAEAAEAQMVESKLNPATVPAALRESIRKERDPAKRLRLIESVVSLSAGNPGSASGWPTGQTGDLKTRLAGWKA